MNKNEQTLFGQTRAQGSRAKTPLSFSRTGNNFVYSDNPESFTLSPDNLYSLWGGNLTASYKEFEMYHMLNNGWGNNASIYAVIAVYNSTRSTVTVTYKESTASLDIDPQSQSDALACPATTSMQQYYHESAWEKTVYVAAGEVVDLSNIVTQFKSKHRKFIGLRGCVKASVNSGVKFRVYVAGAEKRNYISELFTTEQYETAVGTQFCGELPYSEVRATIPWSTSKKYMIFEHPVRNNRDEYATAITYKDSISTLAGNFGVKYHLTITGTSGKYIWIEPDWTIDGRTKATIVYRFNNGSWIARSTPITQNACWYLALPTNSAGNTTVDIILPGGNFGNYWVYFS